MAEQSGEPASPRELGADAEKRQALSRLRERYGEARNLVSSDHPYADLEWILGAKKDPDLRPADLDDKRLRVLALWLQDLASEVDRPMTSEPEAEMDEATKSARRARQSVASNLRAAAEGLAIAFRPSS